MSDNLETFENISNNYCLTSVLICHIFVTLMLHNCNRGVTNETFNDNLITYNIRFYFQ